MRPQRPHRTMPVSSARPPRPAFRAIRRFMWAFSASMRWFLLEPRPVDVALVVVADQYVPVRHRPVVARGLYRTPVHHPGPRLGSAEGVGTGIQGAVQDLHDAVVGGRPPVNPTDRAVAPDHG